LDSSASIPAGRLAAGIIGAWYKKVETRSKECYMKELTNMQDNRWSPGYPFYKDARKAVAA